MTISSHCALIIVAAGLVHAPISAAEPTNSVYRINSPEVIVRGQSPFYGGDGSAAPPTNGGWQPQVPFNPAQDPFLPQTAPNSTPFAPNYPGTTPVPSWLRRGPSTLSGLNGPQPYRLGRPKLYLDFEFMPGEGVSRGQGDFEIFGFDSELEFTRLVGPNVVFTSAPQFGLRTWQTPVLVGNEQLSTTVFRFGWDFEFATPENGSPWGAIVGFNPSINSDFESGLTSRGVNLDGRAAILYRASSRLQYIAGLMYWDRVNDRVLPYGGLVWTPDDRGEFRIMFPESRISYYIGNFASDDKWIYLQAGYHVEAYQVDIGLPGGGAREDQIEIADWRVVFGLRSENNYFGTFIEAGYVFDREVEFGGQTTDFTIDDGFLLRAGIRF